MSSGRVCVQWHHPQLHAAIEQPQFNLSAKTFHTLARSYSIDFSNWGTKISLELKSEVYPADENGNIGGEKRDKDQSKRLGSGSSTLRRRSLIYWVWTLSIDHYGLLFLERSRLWRLAKTIIVRLERVDRSVKKHVFLWTTPKMCEMTAIDW